MEPFLSKVAKVYAEKEKNNLLDYCFVFPNKRSSTFFSCYLAENIGQSILPKTSTISDFILDFSSGTEAYRIELLFLLYDVYRNLLQNKSADIHIVEFDKFQFWAEMILNDFNDIDKYLVDAKQLYINIFKLKEINSNFLTQEQIEVINYYWGENRVNDISDSFWKHIKHNEGDLSDNFIKLWQILYELYESFKERLTDLELCYSGMAYREVAESKKLTNKSQLPYKRYIFVGFNALSTSEIKIFEQLQAIGCADFYWDYDSFAFKQKYNSATRFVGKYVKWFKSYYDIFEDKDKEELPNINVIGVPSNIGQLKETSSIISNLYHQNNITEVNTAIVLPDEDLFIPLLHSLPKEIDAVNVTMGYPMRNSTVASLIKNIISLQLRARIVYEETQYFYDDIYNVLTHPLIKRIAGKECFNVIRLLNDKRLFNISSKFLVENYHQLSPIFYAVNDLKDVSEVISYIKCLISWIESSLNNDDVIDIAFIKKYINAVEIIENLIYQYNIEIADKTVFHLIERIVGSETINFIGEPLKGLQVMGVLETRALDFENIIILSMNERIYPRKHFSKTFIPNALRRGYGMSTISFQESMYAYYFYRMISRAKNVYVMYDARTGGIRSGEMSRFLYQLKFLYNKGNFNFSIVNYDVLAVDNKKLTVEKTPQIMKKLNVYKDKESNRYLSASALNKYISCPLSFYLFYVEGMQHEDEITDYMDEGTYGTIMHEVAENFYMKLKNNADEVLITEEILDRQKHRQGDLMKQITRSINYHYNKLGKDNDTPLHGDSKVIGEIMLHFTLLLFENEKQFTDFYFIDAEHKQSGQWEINDKHTINFKQIIDRLDKIKLSDDTNFLMRFVDYKTGSDKVDVTSIESLFDGSKNDRRKAVFQLFVYCLYYAYYTGFAGDIQPYIYTFKTLNTEHLPSIKIAKKEVVSYLEYKEEFWTLFEKLINEIFDENIPFTPALNNDACHYCKFLELCNKKF